MFRITLVSGLNDKRRTRPKIARSNAFRNLMGRVAVEKIVSSIMPIEDKSSSEVSVVAAPDPFFARRWFELFFVLLIAFGAYLVNSIYFHLHQRIMFPVRPSEMWGYGIAQEAISLALVGYVLSRRNIRWRDMGLRWSIRDLATGPLIAIQSYTAYWVTYHLLLTIHNTFLPSAQFTREPSAPSGLPPLTNILFYLLNPFFEELIVRAYLMTEVHALTGSWKLAAGLSTLVQASFHIYYGWPVMTALALQFFVFSIYYARKQRATPLIVAHGLFDMSWVALGLIYSWV